MKKMTLVIAILFYLSGCAIAPKSDAVRTAADRSEFEGLNKDSKFSISMPSTHSGPYGSIDQLNFSIEEGKYKGKNASAIIAQSKSTETWEVLMILINENDRWIKLPKTD